jgi:hypothetical protein
VFHRPRLLRKPAAEKRQAQCTTLLCNGQIHTFDTNSGMGVSLVLAMSWS